MDATTSSSDHAVATTPELAPALKRMGRLNRWDTPWFNAKLMSGVAIIGTILLVGILGRFFWNTDLAYAASSPLNLPPAGFEYETATGRQFTGTWDHPLGTENSGRDMLALMIVAAPNSFLVGVIAAGVGMSVGIILGFSAGFLGGRVDDFIRLMSDVTVTIPALMVLIVIQSLLTQIELITMALLIALFAWPSPTRLIRAQVLSMRESGYVRMAKLSGASSFNIMFREMLPNLLPYIVASFIGNAAGAILTAIGLEVLGLGPQRVPTLGGTIYFALGAAAMLRNIWWWWGLPTLLLAIMFIGLLLINLGFDEIANPRLRQSSQ